MIYTLTLTPSIDYYLKGAQFKLNHVNRFSEFELFLGGKGLNASVVMQRHGFDNHAITFLDQTSFDLMQPSIVREQIKIFNIPSLTPTRINVKYYGDDTHFELNGPRLILSQEQTVQLWRQMHQLQSDDLLMIMGVGEPTLVHELVVYCHDHHIPFVLDIDSPDLAKYLQYGPFLIKPNVDELQRIFHFNIQCETDIIEALLGLRRLGCENAMISFDKQGAYLIDQTGAIYRAEVIKSLENVVSATGAGDTLVAIFVAHYLKHRNSAQAFELASAAAMGTVSQRYLSDPALTNCYLEHIKVVRVA